MKRIDEINAMADAKQANQAWIDLDAEIMKKSPSIPILLERKPLLVGPNIAGATATPCGPAPSTTAPWASRTRRRARLRSRGLTPP